MSVENNDAALEAAKKSSILKEAVASTNLDHDKSLQTMTEDNIVMKEVEKVIEKKIEVPLRGSLIDTESAVRMILNVANNHEKRYKGSWKEMLPEELVNMIQDKVGRRFRTLTTNADKLEEAIDGAVYNIFLVSNLLQEIQNFKYPTREDKVERDHEPN